MNYFDESAGTERSREMLLDKLYDTPRREVLLHDFTVASRPQYDRGGFISRGAELRERKVKLYRHREWKKVN
jgi:hypothetical protein